MNIYIETDHHANNIWGLLNPDTEIEAITPQGDLYHKPVNLNSEQEFLWDLRLQALHGASKITGKNPVTYLHLGDFVQGWKHPTEVVDQSAYAETCIAKYNLMPVFEKLNVERARFVLGTGAHDGWNHDSVKSLTGWMKGHVLDTRMIRHGLLEVDGITIDFAHHGSGKGRRDWLKGNEMRYYTKSIMSQELKRGRKPPDILLRGHFHGFHWETVRERVGGKFYTTECILVPSWCGLGAYGQQVTRSEYMITNGSLLLEINDGHFKLNDWIVERDLRSKEVI